MALVGYEKGIVGRQWRLVSSMIGNVLLMLFVLWAVQGVSVSFERIER
jgi:hypothetical protein